MAEQIWGPQFDLMLAQAANNNAAARKTNEELDAGMTQAEIDAKNAMTQHQTAAAELANQGAIAQKQANENEQIRLESVRARQKVNAIYAQGGQPTVPQAGPANRGDASIAQANQNAQPPQNVFENPDANQGGVAQGGPIAPPQQAPAYNTPPLVAPAGQAPAQGQAPAPQMPNARIGGNAPTSTKETNPLAYYEETDILPNGQVNDLSNNNSKRWIDIARQQGLPPEIIADEMKAKRAALVKMASDEIKYQDERQKMRKSGLDADEIEQRIDLAKKKDDENTAAVIKRQLSSKDPVVKDIGVKNAKYLLNLDLQNDPSAVTTLLWMADASEKQQAIDKSKREDATQGETVRHNKQTEANAAGHLAIARQGAAEQKATSVREANRLKTMDLQTSNGINQATQQISEVDRVINGGQVKNAAGIENFLGLTKIPGSPWRTAKQDITNVVNNAVLSFKQAVIQGGGSVRMFDANKENEALEKAVANMDWNAGDEFITQQLNNIKSRMSDTVQRLNQARGLEGLPPILPKSAEKAPDKPSIPSTNSKGWPLHTDANGNKAYVSPDRKQFEEVK